ncbi:MAG: S53 family peptidase [Solirubrobacteraceae bacterium]
MRHNLRLTAIASLLLGMGSVGVSITTAAASTASSPAVLQSSSPVATPANQVAATPASTSIDFNVSLQLSNPAGAVALERAVSDPSSSSYRHYLTAAQWESRFSPSKSSVEAVTSWLKSEGIAVEAVTPDRMTVQATASAATVAHAFHTSLGEYRHLGKVVRLSAGALKVPGELASLITGVTGIDQSVAKPAALTGAQSAKSATSTATPNVAESNASKPIPQPPGFRNAPPCSSYYGKKSDTTDPAYGDGFPDPLPYAVCGYVPAQYQGAYGLTKQIAGGINGKGVTVAIVDAYVSPTLLSDAEVYSQKNQPKEVLQSGQFSELLAKSFNQVELCEASEWYGEQTLDVEAVHATAPGANILYVGAKNCVNGLYNSVQEVVDGHLADIITNSWGDTGGDLLDSRSSRRGFDNILLMAAGTGIGVQFSAGDNGDEFTTLGMTVADYPSSSPYQTSVGGTSLQVGKANTRVGELGWSTSRSVLCTTTLEFYEYPGCTSSTLNTWLPPAPGEYDYGGGGGTSYQYAEPWYQEGVVPAPLAERNSAVTGTLNRVEPDISMDGDPTTGMLVGETQEFPNGTYYDQYRIGGTSLSSPLFAGVMADADQAAGGALGFVNPLLYQLDASSSGAFYDIVPGGKQALVRNDYINGINAKEGLLTSVRVLDFEGEEVYCSGTGNCTVQNVALNTAPGFDSMTGIGTPAPGLVAALAATP